MKDIQKDDGRARRTFKRYNEKCDALNKHQEELLKSREKRIKRTKYLREYYKIYRAKKKLTEGENGRERRSRR